MRARSLVVSLLLFPCLATVAEAQTGPPNGGAEYGSKDKDKDKVKVKDKVRVQQVTKVTKVRSASVRSTPRANKAAAPRKGTAVTSRASAAL